MKKGIPGYLLIAVICIMVLLLLYQRRPPFGKDNTSFAVKDGTEITGIDLIEGERKVVLRKERENWIVNKSGEARKSAVLFLIRTLREMKIKSPVSPDIFREEIADMKIEPVRVNVYEKRRIVKSFYVYRTASNIYGNFMKVRGASKPFIVYIPATEINIGGHFNANELFWQPFAVFRLLPSRIASVELQNFDDPSASFTIHNKGSYFSVSDNAGLLSGWDSTRVKRYLSYFVSVSFESRAFELDEEQKREIFSSGPLYKITVVSSDGGVTRLVIRERWHVKEGLKVKDTDRVWGDMEDGKGLFVMRYFDLDPVLRKKSYFFGG